jgi:hypothetical protein
VYHAYNDRDGVTHAFTLNGLKHANALMGENTFNMEDWEAIGEYDSKEGRHHAFVVPRKDVVIDGVPITKGERVRIEESYKYSREEAKELWESAKLAENVIWATSKGDYGQYMYTFASDGTLIFTRPSFRFEARGVLPDQARGICRQASAITGRMERAMGSLGCRHQADDSRNRAALQAHQAPQ